MAILVDKNSRIIIQGITGKVGQVFSERMVRHNTPLVGGVSPGKGGTVDKQGVPVFNSVMEVKKSLNPNWSLIAVPAPFVKDAAIEAMESGIKNIVIYSEGVPFHDSLYMVNYANLTNTMIFGPNSAGVVSPGKANVSDLNDAILKEGNIGIVSKSGTLTYEIIELLEKSGLGISTVACLGGDPIIGTNYVDVLKKFNEDDETKLVIMLGEIGGQLEIKAAEYIKHMKKSVVSYIVGQSAPPGKKMGHAGALISNLEETAEMKNKALKEAGAFTISVITEIPEILKDFRL